MKRERQSPGDQPEYLPSTTRAVAWGAMFFAVLAFLMSGATLLLTYKDGRLVTNLTTLLRETRQTIDKAREQKDDAEESPSERLHIKEQLDRYAKMIQQGDGQARYYLDGLCTDLEKLRAKATADGGKWIAETKATVEAARNQLRDNAPEAARKLRDLAGKLGTVAEVVRGVQSAPSAEVTPHPGEQRP